MLYMTLQLCCRAKNAIWCAAMDLLQGEFSAEFELWANIVSWVDLVRWIAFSRAFSALLVLIQVDNWTEISICFCLDPLLLRWTIINSNMNKIIFIHNDVIKWKHFPRYWPFVGGIHRSPVNSPHKGQWRGALMYFFICAWINGWVNNGEAADLRRHRTHYDATIMYWKKFVRM